MENLPNVMFILVAALASPQILCMHIQFLNGSFLSVTSMRNYLIAVKLWQLYQDLTSLCLFYLKFDFWWHWKDTLPPS